MKNLLILLFSLACITSYAQGPNSFGGIALRVNDTTTYQTNAAAFHTAGYYDIYFNNQATNDHWDVWNGSSYDHIFAFNSGGGGAGTPGGSDTQVQYNDGGAFGGEAVFIYNETTNLLTVPNVSAGSSSSLTNASTVTITGTKHTLTSTQATITWTLSQTGDFQTTDIILNATSATWTFPANTLCIVEGIASGTNTAALAGVSGDHYILSIYKDGTNYRAVIKNFGQ